MYFWVMCITCPFKLITGQQGGNNLNSVVITKSLISIFFQFGVNLTLTAYVCHRAPANLRCPLHYRSCEQFQLNSFQADWLGFIRSKIWIHRNRSDSLGMFAEEPAKPDFAHSLTVLPAGGEKLLLSNFGWQWEGPYCVMESRWGEVRIKKRVRICASSKSAAPDLERWVTSWFAEIMKIEAIVESKLTPGCVCCQVVGSSDFEPGLPRSTWVRGKEMH